MIKAFSHIVHCSASLPSLTQRGVFFFFLINLFFGCAGSLLLPVAFLYCGEWALFLAMVHRLLTAVASCV